MRATLLALTGTTSRSFGWTWWLRLLVTAYLLFLVWAKLHEATYDWRSVWQTAHPAWLLAALLFVPLNLGLETLKWWRMVRRFYPWLRLRDAWLRVLAGAAAGFVTPNRWGEYAGRVLSLPTGHRTEAAWATLLSRLAQLAATLLAGGWALLTMGPGAAAHLPGSPWLGLLCALAATGIAFACLYPHRWLHWILHYRMPTWLPLRQIHEAAQRIPPSDRAWTLALGLVRYGVFVVQVGLALWAYGAEVPIGTIVQFCGLLFLGKAIVPSVALAELGVREALALALAGWLLLPAGAVFNATLLIFAVNLLLPALLGAVCLWGLAPSGRTPADLPTP